MCIILSQQFYFQMDEMENLRIEGELEKQKMMRVRGAENRDSGVADMEIIPQTSKDGKLSPESAASANNLKRSALSNSLLDLHEQRKNINSLNILECKVKCFLTKF